VVPSGGTRKHWPLFKGGRV